MLTIVIGRAKTGKSERLLRRIQELGDSGKQILLVPEHASHQAEVDLCRACGPTASRHAEVLSFRRLCDRENPGTCANAPAGPASASGAEELYLFTTKTCPNCKIAKNELEKAGLAYQVMDVAEHMDLVNEYGIQQAPTLIVRHGDQVEKLVNASVIKKYAATHE